ncbi:uncharacterized protein RCC_06204 [Ramularia collo-cygni]|uniref:Uncharacterized protein n=1 Tax=Ramularia collo-cygni TaxID=112498 RepID=A0A2D3V0U8_9PEZI|nr:uncharacterized protein RCC_06204 [Ramularia collo-cygni]CZT20345.1 uncharacterized protein RCC_06204 [Ramularia collo-cygni]
MSGMPARKGTILSIYGSMPPEIDDMKSGHRHFSVPNSRPEAALMAASSLEMPETNQMTRSGKDLVLEEQRKPTVDRRPTRQAEFAKEVAEAGGVDDRSEDELA